jgi:ribonuclease D
VTNTELAVPEYELVTGNAQLQTLCKIWEGSTLLAMDTEFIRTQTFYPQLGLLQLCNGEHTWLIDPLTIDDWTDFKALMLNKAVTKVFHSCSEDLLVFIAFFGLVPTPVFDSQIAATLLNFGLSISYQNLVNHFTGIDLPKGETRSDWLQRPLSQNQLDYAALDVIYLPDIARNQQKALAEAGKTEWAEEEFLRLEGLNEQEFTRDFSDFYMSLKGGWQFTGEQLLALKLLCIWREERARERDRPRSWILKDTALYEIARLLPATRGQMADIADISTNFMRYEGDRILALVEQAQSASADDHPPALPKPLTTGQKNRVQKAKKVVELKAQELQVPVEYLGRRKTLVEFIQSLETGSELPRELKGWRGRYLLQPLQEALTQGSGQ